MAFFGFLGVRVEVVGIGSVLSCIWRSDCFGNLVGFNLCDGNIFPPDSFSGSYRVLYFC